jgi:hypothetical protein
VVRDGDTTKKKNNKKRALLSSLFLVPNTCTHGVRAHPSSKPEGKTREQKKRRKQKKSEDETQPKSNAERFPPSFL